ncbi:MAG: hypothetical protein JWO80_2041 [Bryobacterales bacterium]|nr:hypothetical protein [Bryobacterales bacterium]
MQLNKFTLVWALVASTAVAAAMAAATTAGTMQSVSVVHVPQGGEPIAAQLAPDGTIHLLYNLGDIPHYVKSSDSGATFTTPLPVVNEEARKQGLKFDAWSVAVGKTNTIYVCNVHQ